MSLKDKQDNANKEAVRNKRIAKIAAVGLSISTFIGGLGIGGAVFNRNNIKDLENQIASAESRLELVEKEVADAKITDEQNKKDILVLNERCTELQAILDKYQGMDEVLAEHQKDLDKIEKLIEGIQNGSFSGQLLVDAISDLQKEMANQTKAILSIIEDLKKENQSSNQETQTPEVEITNSTVFDGIDSLATASQIEEKIIININKITLDVVSGVRTDYKAIFADLELAEEKLNKLGLSADSINSIHKEIIEAEIAVAKKDYVNSMADIANSKYSKIIAKQITKDRSMNVEMGYGKNEEAIYGLSIDEKGNNDYIVFGNGKAVYASKYGNLASYSESNDNFSVYMNEMDSLMSGAVLDTVVESYENGEIKNVDLERSNSGYNIDYKEGSIDYNAELILGVGVKTATRSNALTNNVVNDNENLGPDQENVAVNHINYEIEYVIESMTKEEFNEKETYVIDQARKIQKLAEQQKVEQNSQQNS